MKKITVAKEVLQNSVAAVQSIVPARPTHPLLSSILFSAGPEGVQLSGTDIEVAIVMNIPAEVSESTLLALPGKKLFDIVKELPAAPVSIQIQDQRAELKCGKSTFKLHTLDAGEYPTMPDVDFSNAFEVSGKVLHELVNATAFAVSTEESRPILNGILWDIKPGEMRMVATNGHRLARATIAIDEGKVTEARQLIVPPRAMAQVLRLFSASDTVQVAGGGSYIAFRKEGVTVYARLIDGPYPNYEQIIPRDNDKTLTVSRETFLASLRRMNVVASDQTHRIRFAAQGSSLRMAVETPDIGEAAEEIDAAYQGEPIEIAFNGGYLIEILKIIPSEEVTLSFKDPGRATVIVPARNGKPHEGANLMMLAMPLRLLD